jgi:hypothetical protein
MEQTATSGKEKERNVDGKREENPKGYEKIRRWGE